MQNIENYEYISKNNFIPKYEMSKRDKEKYLPYQNSHKKEIESNRLRAKLKEIKENIQRQKVISHELHLLVNIPAVLFG